MTASFEEANLRVGTTVPPRLEVFSAGNGGETDGYFSLTKEVKNGLIVGNWHLSANRINRHSSLGPTYDGRIKPDVVAPGTYVRTPGFWDPTGTDFTGYSPCIPLAAGTGAGPRRNFYGVDCGTSLSAPAVTGLLALALQQYGLSYGTNIDILPPLPSTLRGLLIHSARDISGPVWFSTPDPSIGAFPGPDFVTGFGMPDAERALDIVKRHLIVEDHIDSTCHVKQYPFYVPTAPFGAIEPDSVKVTLAWDDPANYSVVDLTYPRLINDLDLVLIDPAGVRHFPWQLDQQILDAVGNPLTDDQQPCGKRVLVKRHLSPFVAVSAADVVPASLGHDHLNNVEQVVSKGIAGWWVAEVSGFALPRTRQRFSLIGLRFLRIDPRGVCSIVPSLCNRWRAEGVCLVYPPLCDGEPRFIPFRDSTIVLTIQDPRDRVIILLKDLCRWFGVSDGCGDPVQRYDLLFGSPMPLAVELYSSAGRRVAGDSVPTQQRRISVSPTHDETYVMIFTPPQNVRIGQEFEVRLSIRRLPN